MTAIEQEAGVANAPPDGHRDTGPPVSSWSELRPSLNGSPSSAPDLVGDAEAWRRVAADPSRLLAERVEAYEDLIDSEIGDTTLTRARNLEREHGLRQLYVKFDGGNPTGTQKDRIAFAQALDALRRGFDVVTVATCGNYGAAMALACSLAGLRCVVHLPAGFHSRRLPEMEALGAEIVRTEGDYEAAVAISRERAARDELYDANPGGANTPIQLRAYGQIAYELYDELRDAPAAVAVPVSNGTTLAGIHRGFQSLLRRGKTSRLPRIIAGSSYGKNPIIRAFRKALPSCDDLAPEAIRETPVNEPLVNWHAIDGEHALAALRESDGWAAPAGDRTLQSLSRLLREREGLHVLPASTAGLHALLDLHRRNPLPGDRYVAVLTGRRA